MIGGPWKAPNPPPWTIGYASSYAGNTWRAGVMDRLTQELIGKWKKLGLLKEVIVTQSNLNDALQIQQMRQLVDRGVDALIVCCDGLKGLPDAVRAVWPKATVQTCVVHLVRNSLRYASKADW